MLDNLFVFDASIGVVLVNGLVTGFGRKEPVSTGDYQTRYCGSCQGLHEPTPTGSVKHWWLLGRHLQ